ncbi:MAG: hypothetical protein PF445_06530, partial [Melioribacteraceae bacterium]|nr:hypothetical protein [Melioribacteraceae bacterium]
MKIIEQNIPFFNFLVSPISGEKVTELLSKTNDGIVHYLEVNSEEWLSLVLSKETHLFNYKSPIENLENVGNDTIDESMIHSLEDLHSLKKINDKFFAGSDGILVKYDKVIKFVTISYNGICHVEVSQDKKTATAKFYPAANERIQLTENDVISIIKGKNISVNLEMIEIHSALDYVNKNKEVLDQVVVAKGKEPKLGKEGWTEF